MTINNKTLTTVENLVTNPTTTEGNFRIGLGDALIELNSINEKPPHLHTAVSGTTVNLDVSSLTVALLQPIRQLILLTFL